MTVRLKQRTYLDSDGNAVGVDHPGDKTLFGPENAEIPDRKAKELGLNNGVLPKSKKAVKKFTTKPGEKGKDKAQSPGDDKADNATVKFGG